MRRAISVLPTPVGPIRRMFFGVTSSRTSGPSFMRRRRLPIARHALCRLPDPVPVERLDHPRGPRSSAPGRPCPPARGRRSLPTSIRSRGRSCGGRASAAISSPLGDLPSPGVSWAQERARRRGRGGPPEPEAARRRRAPIVAVPDEEHVEASASTRAFEPGAARGRCATPWQQRGLEQRSARGVEVGLEALEEPERVGGAAREPRDDAPLPERAHLDGAVLLDGVPERHLAVAGHDALPVARHREDRRHFAVPDPAAGAPPAPDPPATGAAPAAGLGAFDPAGGAGASESRIASGRRSPAAADSRTRCFFARTSASRAATPSTGGRPGLARARDSGPPTRLALGLIEGVLVEEVGCRGVIAQERSGRAAAARGTRKSTRRTLAPRASRACPPGARPDAPWTRVPGSLLPPESMPAMETTPRPREPDGVQRGPIEILGRLSEGFQIAGLAFGQVKDLLEKHYGEHKSAVLRGARAFMGSAPSRRTCGPQR